MTHILHEDHLVQTEHWKRNPSKKNIHCLGSFKCDRGSENKGDMIIANSLTSVASQWGSLLLCSRVLTRPRGPHSQPHWTHSTPIFMTQWRSQVSSCLAWDIRLVDACGAECTSGLESEWDLRPMSPTLPVSLICLHLHTHWGPRWRWDAMGAWSNVSACSVSAVW